MVLKKFLFTPAAQVTYNPKINKQFNNKAKYEKQRRKNNGYS